MSHEITALDGQICMAYADEPPWHGLGTKIPSDLTPEQILIAANLDWTVSARPMYAIDKAKDIRIPGHSALVRDTDNQFLSIIGNDWNPVQNKEAFDFFTDFVMKGDMDMHTAGALRNGQMVWALAKIKESFSVFNGDEIESYLLFSNPHEYGRSIDIRFTPIRVVCQNTLTLSLSKNESTHVRVNHRREFDPALVKEMLSVASSKLGRYKEQVEFLGSKKFKIDDVQSYFDDIFPLTSNKKGLEHSRNSRIAMDILPQQPGAKYARGTWWQPFNAVTFMQDHMIGKDENRFYNGNYGNVRTKKLDAMDKALEYAEAA